MPDLYVCIKKLYNAKLFCSLGLKVDFHNVVIVESSKCFLGLLYKTVANLSYLVFGIVKPLPIFSPSIILFLIWGTY